MSTAGCLLLLTLAHPFHFTTSEVEWNEETNRIEVALRANGNDLENAASRTVGRRLNLKSGLSQDAKRSWERFLGTHFLVSRQSADSTEEKAASPSRDEAKEEFPLRMIGVEEEGVWVWLYFEVDPPAGDLRSMWLTNTLLLASDPTHFNQIVFLHRGKRTSLRCDRETPSVRFPTLVGNGD